MDDAERMAQLLLELRMDAAALGKSLGKKDGDTIRNVLNRKNGISARMARAIAIRMLLYFASTRLMFMFSLLAPGYLLVMYPE